MSTLYKYIIIAMAILLLVFAGGGYYMYNKWDTANTNYITEKAKTTQLEAKIEGQEKAIADQKKQNQIINSNLETLNRQYDALERDYIDAQKQLETELEHTADKGTQEAEESYNNIIGRTMERLEKSSRK